MDILRITKAEFIKIFKKPSVYIMAGFLLVSIFLTTIFYHPVVSASQLVSINGSTVTEVYTNYKSNSGVDIESEYLKNITDAENMLAFYSTINDRIQGIDNYYEAVNISYQAYELSLKNYTSAPTAVTRQIVQKDYDTFVISLKNYMDFYNSCTEATDFILTAYSQSQTYIADSATFTSIYQKFSTEWHYSAGGVNNEQTAYNQANTDNIFNSLDNISKNAKLFILSTLQDMANDVKSKEASFLKNSMFEGARETTRQELVTATKDYYAFVTSLVENENPITLTSKSEYQTIKDTISAYLEVIDSPTTVTPLISTTIASTLKEKHYGDAVVSISKSIEIVTVDQSVIDTLRETFTEKIDTKIDSVTLDIEAFASEHAISSSTNDKTRLLEKITKIKELCNRTKLLYSSTIYYSIVEDLSANTISNLYSAKLNGINLYKLKENIVKYNYLNDVDKYQFEHGNVYNTHSTYSSETTGYDFMYFSLSLSTLFIILFAIAMITNLISYENDNGTIKLILIRPFNRHKVITGKLLATLSFAVLFEVFAFVVSLIYGAGMYGLSTLPILGVFNSSVAYTVSPLVLGIVFLVASIGEIIFFTILATLISTICKTLAGSIATNYITYAVIILCNALFGSFVWYSYLPFVGTNLFKFFGVANVSASTNFLNMILCTPTTAIMNFFYSLALDVSLVFIMMYATYVIFKHRDY